MADQILADMKLITERILNKEASLSDVCGSVKKWGSIIPHECIQYITEWIDKLGTRSFWVAATEPMDYLSLKHSRRFFPHQDQGATPSDRKEWGDLTKKVLKEEYPDADTTKSEKHSNFSTITDVTNYGVMTPWDGSDAVDEKELAMVIDALSAARQTDLLVRLIYRITCGYNTCHLPYQMPLIAELLDRYLSISRHRDLLLVGLWYGSRIIAHEEELMREHYAPWNESHRAVMRLSKLQTVWMQHMPLNVENNPLVTVSGSVVPVQKRLLFHLRGPRRLVDLKELERRIAVVTGGSLVGMEKYDNVVLCGSTITECAADLQITRFSTGTQKDWALKSKLYYMGGDIDIAVKTSSYKEFMNRAEEIIKLISKNLGSPATYTLKTSASGVRFQVRHTKLDRHFEIFRTPLEFIRLVGGFHVPCVKAYWDFSRRDLIMTRSFVTAMVTGVLESFDWFSTLKNPIDVILKYAQRGYSTALNDKEFACVEAYLAKKNGAWSYPQYASRKGMAGSFTNSHPFFRIESVPKGVRHGMQVMILDTEDDKNGELGIDPVPTTEPATALRVLNEIVIKKKIGTGNCEYLVMPPLL